LRFRRRLISFDPKIEEQRLMTLRAWFSCNGRIGRRTWWVYYFLVPLLLGLAVFLMTLGFSMLLEGLGISRSFDSSAVVITMFLMGSQIFSWVIWLSGCIKRCHDLNLSGRWPLVLVLPGLLFTAIYWDLIWADVLKRERSFLANWALSLSWLPLIPLGSFLLQMVLLGLMRGTRGPNRFGPDPLAPPAANIALPPLPQ
jgi:uncharacterized membrane protein YhaH (DUF805 family)